MGNIRWHQQLVSIIHHATKRDEKARASCVQFVQYHDGLVHVMQAVEHMQSAIANRDDTTRVTRAQLHVFATLYPHGASQIVEPAIPNKHIVILSLVKHVLMNL